MFSPTGALLSRWGVRGRGPGQLQRPTGIAVMKVDITIVISIIINVGIIVTVKVIPDEGRQHCCFRLRQQVDLGPRAQRQVCLKGEDGRRLFQSRPQNLNPNFNPKFPTVGRKQASRPERCRRCRLWRNHRHRQQGLRSLHPTSCLRKGDFQKRLHIYPCLKPFSR